MLLTFITRSQRCVHTHEHAQTHETHTHTHMLKLVLKLVLMLMLMLMLSLHSFRRACPQRAVPRGHQQALAAAALLLGGRGGRQLPHARAQPAHPAVSEGGGAACHSQRISLPSLLRFGPPSLRPYSPPPPCPRSSPPPLLPSSFALTPPLSPLLPVVGQVLWQLLGVCDVLDAVRPHQDPPRRCVPRGRAVGAGPRQLPRRRHVPCE